MNAREAVLAVDLGGTSMKCALATPDGELLHREQRPTERERGPDAAVAALLRTCVELAALPEFEVKAAGVAVPGLVDEAAGVARSAANIGWKDVPLRRLVSEALDVPAALGHDLRAAGLAEARLGVGRESRELLFVAVGTGIAGAHVVDGRLLPGAHGAAVELGHVQIRPLDGPMCGCGRRGCLETLASAAAVERRWKETTGEAAAAKDVVIAAAVDPRAERLWAETVEYLAEGLNTAAMLLDPDTIALGGGLSEADELLFPPLEAALRRRAGFFDLPRLVRAELGESAGCVGAALLGAAVLEGEAR